MSRLFFSILMLFVAGGLLVLAPEHAAAREPRTIDKAFDFTGPNFVGPKNNYLDRAVGWTGVADTTIPEVIGTLAKAVFWLSGMAFFVLMVYGGFMWMSSHGNEDMVKKGQNTIIAAVIGLAILVSAYAITNLVSKRLIAGEAAPRGATPPAGGELRCCIDWVASEAEGPLTGDTGVDGNPIERLTTLEDCKAQGETDGQGDNLSGPGPAVGTWLFFSNITTVPACTGKVRECATLTGGWEATSACAGG
ncbi:MAG: pilin [Patescibacteria group bacterium]